MSREIPVIDIGCLWGSTARADLSDLARQIDTACRSAGFFYIANHQVPAAVISDAGVADAELVVVAVPSRVFAEVVETLPGDAPVLSLTKGLDPASGELLVHGPLLFDGYFDNPDATAEAFTCFSSVSCPSRIASNTR